MDEFREYFQAVGQFFKIFKQIKELLPKGKGRDDVTAALEKAELNFKTTEAKLAQSMGFHLCQCEWPPIIMLFKQEHDLLECESCGHQLMVRRAKGRRTVLSKGIS